MIKLLLLLFLLVAQPVWAAATFDAKSGGALTSTSLTVSHTTSGSNRLITACWLTTTNTVTHTSMTYAGVAMTKLSDLDSSATATPTARLSLWYLIAPASGANNLVVTPSASDTNIVAIASYTGVHQTTPIGTAATSPFAITSGPESVTATSATGELVVDCFGGLMASQPRPTAGAGQTLNSGWSATTENPANSSRWVLTSSEAGAASVDMTYTWNATAQLTAIIAAPLKPAAAATTRRRAVMVLP